MFVAAPLFRHGSHVTSFYRVIHRCSEDVARGCSPIDRKSIVPSGIKTQSYLIKILFSFSCSFFAVQYLYYYAKLTNLRELFVVLKTQRAMMETVHIIPIGYELVKKKTKIMCFSKQN